MNTETRTTFGHGCDPPMLWFWRKRKWPDGKVWVCPVCGREWRRDDIKPGGWEWIDHDE
jgi:hypothetical protein